jgi:hypothetical protein
MMAQWGTGNLRSCWLMVHAQEYREMQAGKDITVETFIFILLRGCGSHYGLIAKTREKVCTLVSSLSTHMLFLSRDLQRLFKIPQEQWMQSPVTLLLRLLALHVQKDKQ